MASLLLNVWLLGAIFWQSQYLGRQGHLVRQGWPDGARQRAGQHDVKQRPPDCRRKRSSFCSLYGFNYTCIRVPDAACHAQNQRAPSDDCLGGELSWGVCSQGKFLCKIADCRERRAGSFCSFGGSTYACSEVSGHKPQTEVHDEAPGNECLSGNFSWGICSGGKFFCRTQHQSRDCAAEPSGFCQFQNAVGNCVSCSNKLQRPNLVFHQRDEFGQSVQVKGLLEGHIELRYAALLQQTESWLESTPVILMDWEAFHVGFNFCHCVLMGLYHLQEAILELKVGTNNKILLTDVKTAQDAGGLVEILQVFSDFPISTLNDYFLQSDRHHVFFEKIISGVTTRGWGGGIEVGIVQQFAFPDPHWTRLRSFVYSKLDVPSPGCRASLEAAFLTFVQRLGTTRIVQNVEALARKVNQTHGLQSRVVFLETFSLQKQFQLVTETAVLTGMHGAALTHMVFMRQGSGVLELFPTNTDPYTHPAVIYQNLARSSGMIHSFLHADASECQPGSTDPRDCKQSSFSPFKFDLAAFTLGELVGERYEDSVPCTG